MTPNSFFRRLSIFFWAINATPSKITGRFVPGKNVANRNQQIAGMIVAKKDEPFERGTRISGRKSRRITETKDVFLKKHLRIKWSKLQTYRLSFQK